MRIRVLSGSGTGPTALAARDAALVNAGVGNFNLVRLSSVIPPTATLTEPDEPTGLGPDGGILPVVEAATTVEPNDPAAVALGWARADDGRGLFYEDSRTSSSEASDGGVPRTEERARRMASTAETEIRRGLAHGFDCRGWGDPDPIVRSTTVSDRERHTSVVILATFGTAIADFESLSFE